MGKRKYKIDHEVNITKLETQRKKLNLSQELFAEYIRIGISSYKNLLNDKKCGQKMKAQMIESGVVPVDVFI